MLRNTKPRSAEQSLFFLHLLLPEEIVEDILSRLPVKSLSRFKCVSKSWHFLIESDRFIKTHLQNSTKNMKLAHHRVIFNPNRRVMNGCSLQSLLNSISREGLSSIDDPTNINEPTKTGILVGCCNGVLCVYDQPAGRFLLWNPAARISIKIPKIFRGIRKYGFGWDESSGAYKVFAVVRSNYCFFGTGKVYSSETNLWKSVGCGSLFPCSSIGLFVGGKLNWPVFYSEHHNYIGCFDLGSDEEFGRIELPSFKFNFNAKSRYATWLGEIGGCLSILFDFEHTKSVDVWVMKEYGVKESWFKMLSLPFAAVAVCERIIYEFAPLFGGEGPNGEIFLMFGHTFLVYSPKDGVFSTSKNFESFFGARVYIESLVSPQRILFGHYDTSPVRQRHAPQWHEDYVMARI